MSIVKNVMIYKIKGENFVTLCRKLSLLINFFNGGIG